MTADSIIQSSAFATLDDTAAGERLKSAREARGLSIGEVASEIRLTQSTLEALESMQTDHVSPTILRMQAMAYASFLGLPAGDIADAYAANKVQTDVNDFPVSKSEASDPAARRFFVPAMAAAGLIVAGIAGLFSLRAAAPVSEPELPVYRQVVSKPPSSALERVSGQTLREELSIRAIEPSWIEVRGSDGTIFRNRVMSAGEVYYPRIEARWTVTVTDAGAFEWWLGDQRVSALGASGQSIYSASIDQALETSRAAVATALAEAEATNAAPNR